jgi:hypothetical protein
MGYLGYNNVDLLDNKKKTSKPGNGWKMDSHLQVTIFFSSSSPCAFFGLAKSACEQKKNV